MPPSLGAPHPIILSPRSPPPFQPHDHDHPPPSPLLTPPTRPPWRDPINTAITPQFVSSTLSRPTAAPVDPSSHKGLFPSPPEDKFRAFVEGVQRRLSHSTPSPDESLKNSSVSSALSFQSSIMPARTLPGPLLSLATSGLTGLKSVDADNLSCMWTGTSPNLLVLRNTCLTFFRVVFTKCAENLENGRRLENFSWRLWYREAHFFDEAAPSSPISFDRKPTPQPVLSPPESLSDVSESGHSASDLEDVGRHGVDHSTPSVPESHAPNTLPCLARQESSSRRQTVKHLSPDSFKHLIESLEPPSADAEKWKALKASRESDEHLPSESEPKREIRPAEIRPTDIPPTETSPTESEPPAPAMPKDIPVSRSRTMSDAQGSPSTLSGRSLQRVSSSIVRGFTPENPSISRRLTPPVEATNPQPVVVERKKPTFYLGSPHSDSSDEDDAPLTLKPSIKPTNKSNLSPPDMKRSVSNGGVKRTHFHEIVDTKILPAPQTEDEEDEDEDSAVMSDDDDDEWEDSQSDSGSVRGEDEHLFDKQDTQLTSRPSMLSTLFKSKSDYNLPSQAFRAQNTFVRSRTSPSHTPRPQPVTPTLAPVAAPVSDGLAVRIPPPQSGLAVNGDVSQPIPASPRTTRRKMLASELSESLRRNLLWERQHRALIKRRHTSNDLARLKEFPEGLSGQKETNGSEFSKYAFDSGDAVW